MVSLSGLIWRWWRYDAARSWHIRSANDCYSVVECIRGLGFLNVPTRNLRLGEMALDICRWLELRTEEAYLTLPRPPPDSAPGSVTPYATYQGTQLSRYLGPDLLALWAGMLSQGRKGCKGTKGDLTYRTWRQTHPSAKSVIGHWPAPPAGRAWRVCRGLRNVKHCRTVPIVPGTGTYSLI